MIPKQTVFQFWDHRSSLSRTFLMSCHDFDLSMINIFLPNQVFPSNSSISVNILLVFGTKNLSSPSKSSLTITSHI